MESLCRHCGAAIAWMETTREWWNIDLRPGWLAKCKKGENFGLFHNPVRNEGQK